MSDQHHTQHEARLVFERYDDANVTDGPSGFEKVGFCIKNRVFWTGANHSHAPSPTWKEDAALAAMIVLRWNMSAIPLKGESE